MKRTLPLTLCLLAALLAGACVHHKIIPDEELALIFRDAFLANSYLGDRHPDTDSLKIYEPIFARYGYTTADVQYTIGNFSKRKSARLGDVVERSIELLEAEGKHYNREVAIRDTIDRVATRTFTRRIHADSLIRVRSLRDTARLRFAFDVSPGEYRIRLRYRVDSLDRNPSGLRGAMWLERRDSTRAAQFNMTMYRGREERFTRTFIADSTHTRLHLALANFPGRPKRPSIEVRDLTVEYTPPTAAAVDSLYAKQLDIRIFADEFFRSADSTDRR